MFGLVILLLAPIKDFEVQRLFPIFGYGLDKTFLFGISNLFALSGLGYIYLLPPLLKENTSLKRITIISTMLSSIALFFSVLCILFVFSFHINTNENMTLYLLTMVVHHGNIIHGINILFMLIWILSIVAYISTSIFFVIFVLKKITNIRAKNILVYTIPIALLPCAILFQNNPILYTTIQKFISTLTMRFYIHNLPYHTYLCQYKICFFYKSINLRKEKE